MASFGYEVVGLVDYVKHKKGCSSGECICGLDDLLDKVMDMGKKVIKELKNEF